MNCQEELRVVSICRLCIVFSVVYFESTFSYACLFEFQICSIEHMKYFMNSRDLFFALKNVVS